ncbi:MULTISPECIES: sugar ABC transporter substrate-binding protein [Marinovum]|jgi:ABC-type sugar transport system substrate-binding protein|uniref:ABC-type sugar transport system, substrate-binding protein, contains N-terminal xre family HTH domain n=1 Tax=Marinovum algicola TaxID=42444 RepID=A0A975WEA5_9RHOB|nr:MULTISPECIES: substrate-binding domain-containing protein [Marinovum]MDD9740618.1 substrate-binding domain-containing protein [Marinovum sp. SP66]MDD9746240.1 substrate-binding domain-containing protein [Marinovum sp. PR37]SEK06626.1 ABC-type sugar transport system, substrate-binding protein, contains N-terminal xre family HTH domain [Marinovum algicola]SLN76111.1 ABC transporter periplasmic-binding protein YphF precursor [Marinovum algicola]
MTWNVLTRALRGSAVLLCTLGAQAAAETAVETAASTFSTDLCEPIDKAAVADIPGAVSGFTGYASAPGMWLTEPEASALTGKRIAMSVMSLGHPYFQAIANHWETLAEKYDFELRVFDGRFDAGTVQRMVDDIISYAPDGVAFAPLDSAASVPQVKRMLDAGLKVVTYNVQPAEMVAPRVFANDFDGPRIVGCNLARYFQAKFPERDPVIGIVDQPELLQVQDRKNGFLYGFLSLMPEARVAQAVNGGGVIDKANAAASDLLQAHPDINVIFGINNDSSLGTVAALKAVGKYSDEWGALASVDGSEPIMGELGNPVSPLKAESGYGPYDFSLAAFNLLAATIEGEADETTQVVVGYPPIIPTEDGIESWLAQQYPR